MNRKEFIKTCGFACLGGVSVATLLPGCSPAKMLSAPIEGSDLVVPVSAFEAPSKGEKQYRPYLVVQNERLQFPIYVFRFGEADYSALLMQCSHQGAALQAFGSKLQCPAHGSEFGNRGEVLSAPADQPLRSFPVSVQDLQLKISLK
jgi:Rieske Fe-S protein